MIIPFTLQQLDCIKAITVTKNFKVAAEELLFISQPALSKQIQKLENTLGVSLFERSNKTINLTESGKLFLYYAERILTICDQAIDALEDIKIGNRGKLNIGTTQTIGTYLIPKILAHFMPIYPQIKLNIEIRSTKNIAQGLIDRNIDIAIVGGEVPVRLKKQIEIQEYMQDEIVLIIPISHSFAKRAKKIINKNDLHYLDFINLNSNLPSKEFMDQILYQHGIDVSQLTTILELNSIEAIKTAVTVGLGAAFISVSAIEQEVLLNKIKIIRIKNIKIKRKLSIVSKFDSPKSKSFYYFYNELLNLKNIIE